LNFYAENPHAFDARSLEQGRIFATHTALAWIAMRRDSQLRSALASRDTIGQAKGILMERLGIDAVGAFNLLKKLSQESNTVLVHIAEQVISSRNSPP
jgi:AmiR/NasT family two-component response regulator